MTTTVLARVAATGPLRITPLGDLDAVKIPARNTSGLTLAVGDQVRVTVRSGGALPEVAGRIS